MRLTDDDWATADDPEYTRQVSAHQVTVHTAGLVCRCLPLVLVARNLRDEPVLGIHHGQSWPVRVRRAEGGHP